MKFNFKKLLTILSFFIVTTQLHAQSEYPNKPIRMVIPYAVGGAVDIMGRAIAKELTDITGQSIIVENKGGAGGALAAMDVARSPADGYTIFFGATGPLAIVPFVQSKVNFDPIKDFQPVTLIATSPYVLVVNNQLPVKTVGDLITLARNKPGSLNFASAGTGGPDHLAGELFKLSANLQMQHIPYKGAGPALADVVSGQVQLEFVSPLPAMPLVESGRLRLLAVTTAQRSPAFANIPTVAESGLPGYDVTPWYGFLVKAGTPSAIVKKIHSDLMKVMAKEEMRESLKKRGLDPKTSTPEEFSTFLASEVNKWGKVVREANVHAD